MWSCNKCKKRYYILDEKLCCGEEKQIIPKGTLMNDIIEFRFIDTYRFLSTSLDQAVKNLGEVNNAYCTHCKSKQAIENVKFQPIDENNILKANATCKICNHHVSKPITYKKFNNVCNTFKKEDIHLVLQKGYYPYEWVDNYDKFEQEISYDEVNWKSV